MKEVHSDNPTASGFHQFQGLSTSPSRCINYQAET